MAIPWEDKIKRGKVLTVFPTTKVKGLWLTVFNNAIAEFNKLSRTHGLNVTLSSSQNVTAPDPDGEDGAEVQFDLGNGMLKFQAFRETIIVKGNTDTPINFSPTGLHGATELVLRVFGKNPPRIRRAFIFVPATPMVSASVRIGRDNFKFQNRGAGVGIMLFIAVHEFVHACGLSNSEHNVFGRNADIFTNFPQVSAGAFDKPQDDKLLLHLAHPQPNVFSPPIFLKSRVADLIRNNWT